MTTAMGVHSSNKMTTTTHQHLSNSECYSHEPKIDDDFYQTQSSHHLDNRM